MKSKSRGSRRRPSESVTHTLYRTASYSVITTRCMNFFSSQSLVSKPWPERLMGCGAGESVSFSLVCPSAQKKRGSNGFRATCSVPHATCLISFPHSRHFDTPQYRKSTGAAVPNGSVQAQSVPGKHGRRYRVGKLKQLHGMQPSFTLLFHLQFPTGTGNDLTSSFVFTTELLNVMCSSKLNTWPINCPSLAACLLCCNVPLRSARCIVGLCVFGCWFFFF